MTDIGPTMDPGALEAALVDLGAAIDWPATPDLAMAVTATATAGATEPLRVAATPRRPITRSLRRSLLLAAALVLLVVGTVLAVRVGLGLLQIEFRPSPTAVPSQGPGADETTAPDGSPRPTVTPAPTSTPAPAPSAAAPDRVGLHLGLGIMVPLDTARERTAFRILVPDALGPPDAVFLGGDPLRGQVSLVYAAGSDRPPRALLAGGGLLVTENRGRLDERFVRKIVDAGMGTAERVDVGGHAGYWLAGAPHGFWYLAADGSVIDESGRQVGDTLAWEVGDMLYRIEGARDLEDALAIAASMR